jgi:hypothetical protein
VPLPLLAYPKYVSPDSPAYQYLAGKDRGVKIRRLYQFLLPATVSARTSSAGAVVLVDLIGFELYHAFDAAEGGVCKAAGGESRPIPDYPSAASAWTLAGEMF